MRTKNGHTKPTAKAQREIRRLGYSTRANASGEAKSEMIFQMNFIVRLIGAELF
jgi:hypothetical protein